MKLICSELCVSLSTELFREIKFYSKNVSCIICILFIIGIHFLIGCKNNISVVGQWHLDTSSLTVNSKLKNEVKSLGFYFKSDKSFRIVPFQFEGSWRLKGNQLILIPNRKSAALELLDQGSVLPGNTPATMVLNYDQSRDQITWVQGKKRVVYVYVRN